MILYLFSFYPILCFRPCYRIVDHLSHCSWVWYNRFCFCLFSRFRLVILSVPDTHEQVWAIGILDVERIKLHLNIGVPYLLLLFEVIKVLLASQVLRWNEETARRAVSNHSSSILRGEVLFLWFEIRRLASLLWLRGDRVQQLTAAYDCRHLRGSWHLWTSSFESIELIQGSFVELLLRCVHDKVLLEHRIWLLDFVNSVTFLLLAKLSYNVPVFVRPLHFISHHLQLTRLLRWESNRPGFCHEHSHAGGLHSKILFNTFLLFRFASVG